MVFRCFSNAKEKIDKLLVSQRGTFSSKSPKDLYSVFGISFETLRSTKPLDLGESRLDRLPMHTQEYLLNSLYRYNATFPINQGLTRDFEKFDGTHPHMDSLIEFYIRTLMLSTYEEGITVSLRDPVILQTGERKGHYDLVVSRGGFPILIVKFAKFNEKIRGGPLEQGFCSNIFEIYTSFWMHQVWPVFGCVTDLNSWIFTKYDGKDIHRSEKIFKFALHNTAILSLSNKILNIIDSKVNT